MRPIVAALVLAAMPILASCAEQARNADPLDEALAAIEQGNGLAAEQFLKSALDQGQSRLSIAALMGEAELLQGNLPEAREWLAAGEFDDATRARGFHALARLELQAGNLAAAGMAFDKSLAANPDNAGLWVDIGRLRYRGGEQLQAIEAADHAVALDPGSARALHFRGQLTRDAFGLEPALAWFEAALERSPDDAAVLADYAATLGELGRGRDMLAATRHLARVDPANQQLFYLQAVLAARAGKNVLARSLLQRSGDLDREVPAAMLLSALIDMQGGNYASATQLLARLNEIQPDNRRVEALLARALFLSGSEAELVYRFEQSARRPSASPYLMTLVGRANERLGQREAAAFYLDRAAQPRTTSMIALRSDALTESRVSSGAVDGELVPVVRALIIRGNAQAAKLKMETSQNQFSGSADVSSLAGDAQYAAGSHQSALNSYMASARIRRPWTLTKRMIMTHRVLGDESRSENLLSAYLRGDPGNGEAAGLMAGALANAGRFRQANAVIDHAIADGTVRDANILALRARLAAAVGDLNYALAMARKAHEIQPNNALASSILAPLERTAGQGEKQAERFMEKARALGLSTSN